MNHDETIRKLNELKLFGLAKSFAERRIKPDHMDLSHDEFVGLVSLSTILCTFNFSLTPPPSIALQNG